MIRMEYDVQTAGVRVSFVMLDGDTVALPAQIEKLLMGSVSREGHWTAPQSLENIGTLIAMLESLLDKP